MRNHPLFFAYLAFASVSLFWGTTYLGIRIALETFPPLFLLASRFLLSGTILISVLKVRGVPLPQGRNRWLTALFGLMILGVGNSCLTYSERLIPSSLAALFVAVSPIWMVGLEAVFPGGDRLTAGTAIGIGVGLLGAALLVGPDAFQQGMSGAVVQGFLLLQLGGASWGLGSILQKRLKTEAHPVASAAVQQIAIGLTILPIALWNWQPFQWTWSGAASLAYLTFFGSIIGYTSYIFALSRLPVAIVSLYTYINPVVAAALGWLVYREPFGWREIAAMLVIFAGVAIVKRYGHS